MKIKWYVILLVIFILTVFAGCGKDASNGTDDDKTTISFYTWINEDNGNWEKTIDAFEEEYPDIKIDLNVLVENMSNDDYLEKLDLDASSGENIDVMMFASDDRLSKRISSGMVEPINPYLEKEDFDVEDEYDMNIAPADDKGKYYALPGKQSMNLVMLNKDDLDKAGLSVPEDWTWDDYREYAKKLTTDDHYGSYLHTWPENFDTLKLNSKSKDILLLDEDGSSNMSDPMVKKSLELRHELEQEDKSSVPYADIISQDLDYRQQFFTEEVSMMPNFSYMSTEWGDFTPDFKIAWAPWPKNNKDDSINARTGGDLFSVGKNSEHKEEAYKFIRWMTSKGMIEQNKSIPAWQGADTEEVLKDIVSTTPKPDAVDVDSLAHVLESSESSERFLPRGYLREAQDEFASSVENYLLGDTDIDSAMEDAKKAVQDVIDKNQ